MPILLLFKPPGKREHTGGEIMRKKVVSLLTVMALAIATLAGCASSTDTNATTGTEAATEAIEEAAKAGKF